MPASELELSIILPCYNEAGNLPVLFSSYAALRSQANFELILVNNGSTDTTPQVLADALAKPGFEFVRTVNVPHNIGYGHGLQEGIRAARAPLMALSHADQQCPPTDILKALSIYRKERA